MAEHALAGAADAAPAMSSAQLRRAFDLKRQPGFRTTALLCLAMLYAPIAVLILFSFNANRSVVQWTEFSLDWYVKAFQNADIQGAAITSLKISVAATIASTMIATAAALATTRARRWPGMTSAYMIINLPLMVPEIVTGIATLSFFGLLSIAAGINFGLGKLILAHTVFCIPFAYLPIRARLEDMDLTLEQAAADLYATPWQAFRRVTLPLLTPGISAGAALAFVISFDDFTITQLVYGPGETTLPVAIWSAIRRGVSPELNAISTMLLGISVLFVTLSFLIGRRRR